MKDFAREHAIASRFPDVGVPSSVGVAGLSAVGLGAVPFRPALLPDRYQGRYRGWGKRVLDVAIVVFSLPVTLFVVAVCAIALWIEGGQPFYTQDRLGRNGKRFKILKLRTMVRDADTLLETCLAADPQLRQEWNITQKLKQDPRVTRLGAVLRATSLDELPQLWNVLTGEMSLVGPRPMMPDQLSIYGDPRAYFALRPGVTGAWQVSARNERGFETRAPIDADYHTYVSLREDLLILLRTIGVVLRRTGY
ncbi:sugar transferase [Aestuariivita sp.]|uniref:sugar transferase n=1 Tax=Aestuariivita sp. TaxID=1872407 RepID=UPI0021711104|nr:sugar transferase [Aestuariivita sp.]MCE8009679.1 sugar transferase [Aestuariivita sp.]